MFGIIYCISCNSGVYIGSTNDFKRRKKEHLDMLKTNSHHNYKLQNAFNLTHKLKFSILEKIINCDREYLLSREQHYIDKNIKSCFNIVTTDNEKLSFYIPKLKRRNKHIAEYINIRSEVKAKRKKRRINDHFRYDNIINISSDTLSKLANKNV